jgi:hypothetical protein
MAVPPWPGGHTSTLTRRASENSSTTAALRSASEEFGDAHASTTAGALGRRVSILRGLDCLRAVPTRHRRNEGRARVLRCAVPDAPCPRPDRPRQISPGIALGFRGIALGSRRIAFGGPSRFSCGFERARLLKPCSHRQRFLANTVGRLPSTALATLTTTVRPAPPSRGESPRPKKLLASASRCEKPSLFASGTRVQFPPPPFLMS